jgi:hypothetical protein
MIGNVNVSLLMRDPQVEKLVYELKHGKTIKYENPPPVEWEIADCKFRLSDGTLDVEMLTHCATEDEARQLIDPYLRAWETNAFLRDSNEQLHFEFSQSHIVDRNPPGPGEFLVSPVPDIDDSVSLTFETGRREYQYPLPPTYQKFSPDAETMIFRYRLYHEGKEPLPAMAYFCLTLVEIKTGVENEKRKIAVEKYYVERDILNDIGKLSSTRGDRSNARKYTLELKPLSSKEQTWLDAAIRRLILQVASVDAGEQPSMLTMTDLPGL